MWGDYAQYEAFWRDFIMDIMDIMDMIGIMDIIGIMRMMCTVCMIHMAVRSYHCVIA